MVKLATFRSIEIGHVLKLAKSATRVPHTDSLCSLTRQRRKQTHAAQKLSVRKEGFACTLSKLFKNFWLWICDHDWTIITEDMITR